MDSRTSRRPLHGAHDARASSAVVRAEVHRALSRSDRRLAVRAEAAGLQVAAPGA